MNKPLDDADVRSFWPMVRAAAAYIHPGPSTGEDRWENTPGLSPYTLAAEIAALLVAARLADRFGAASVGQYLRETADLWNDEIERWTYVRGTPLAREVGVDGYYVRIAPSPGVSALRPDGAAAETMKQAHGLPTTAVVSADALALVRFGLRDASDPALLDTVKVVDAMTRVELPAGPCWHRYDGDYYGEHDDGSPWLAGDRDGHGRAWPLLTGERGHYELAAGNPDGARQMLAAMGGFASEVGLIPEQVWDAADIPSRDLYRGRPAARRCRSPGRTPSTCGSSARSATGTSSTPPPTRERYVLQGRAKSELALWRFDHQPGTFLAGRRVRVEVLAPAVVHYSADGWRTAHDATTVPTGLGQHVADLPTARMKPGDRLRFTFRWPAAGDRWEGKDFELSVDDTPRAEVAAREHAMLRVHEMTTRLTVLREQ